MVSPVITEITIAELNPAAVLTGLEYIPISQGGVTVNTTLSQIKYLELTVGSTPILNGTNGYIEYNNNGVLGELPTTGSGAVVLSNNAVLVGPALGTPVSGNLSNCTGVAPGLIAGTVASANILAQTAAVSNIVNYTTPNDGITHTYFILLYANIISSVSDTLGYNLTFRDENNVLQTFGTNNAWAGAGVTGYKLAQNIFARVHPNTSIIYSTLQSVSSGSISYDTGVAVQQLN